MHDRIVSKSNEYSTFSNAVPSLGSSHPPVAVPLPTLSPSSTTTTTNTMQDQRDEEIVELRQKLVTMMKDNNEMKELILFLDDERSYARQFMKDFSSKQNINWNSLKQKMTFLEQRQFELMRENYSLKQVTILQFI